MPRLHELIAMRLRVVAAVALHEPRLADGPTGAPAQRRHRVDQRQQLGHVVPVRGRQERDERNPVRVGENMMFRPGLAAIGRVRSSFFPPRSARSEALSTTARARSSWPRRRNSVSSTAMEPLPDAGALPPDQPPPTGACRSRSPSRAAACSREPRCGARTESRSAPPGRESACAPRIAGCAARRFGSSGSMRVHKSSSIKAWGIPDRLAVGQATVPSLDRSTRGQSVNFATCS